MLRAWVERYAADEAVIRRAYPLETSAARWQRLRALATAWQGEMERLDWDALKGDERVDAVLLENLLGRRLHEIERAEADAARVRPHVAGLDLVLALEDDHRRHRRVDSRSVSAALAAVLAAYAALATDGPTQALASDPGLAQAVADAAGEAAGALDRWFAFYDGYDPVATWWLREPVRRLGEALRAYETQLGELAGRTAITGVPIGEAAVRTELVDALVAHTPEELEALAQRELRFCRAEMVRAATEMGLGQDWRAALERVKETCVEPGDQPEVIYRLAEEACAFLENHDLVTVPPLADETWRAEMMTPERQRINPFFLGGEVIRISYPTDAMSHDQRRMSMRGNNPYFSRSTVFHELIPGHYLQQFMGERQNRHRRLFHTPYWSEGNAFYWEMALWDMGFARTPEERIGMLFWRSHRAARVLYTLAFHAGRMTTEEAVALLVEEIGHEPDNASGEVRRLFQGHYGPLYQCAYMVGAQQFYALRRELVVQGGMAERAFHDAILAQGPMPVEVLRSVLTGRPVERGGPRWRFLDGRRRADRAKRPGPA